MNEQNKYYDKITNFGGNQLLAEDIIGSCAALCTTSAFVPQIIRIWKTKTARDVSIGMYSIFITGVVLWLLYGILEKSIPIIAANTFTLIFSLTVIVLKLNFDKK